MRIGIGLALLMLALAGPVRAQPAANPQLTAYSNGVRAEGRERELMLGRVEIDVAVRGRVAETVMTAVLRNPGREVLEGEFSLALPAGSVVTGYALDIAGGGMVDGVLVDRPRAEAVYEAQVRRGIDPGLAEVVPDGGFRTRVFPISPSGQRTIRVRFVSPIKADGYRLPLTGVAAGGGSIRVRAVGSGGVVTLPGRARSFVAAGASSEISLVEGQKTHGALLIEPGEEDEEIVSRHATGERYIQVTGALPQGRAMTGGTLRIYWDRSRARLGAGGADEQALLRAAVARLRPERIELVLFNSSGAERSVVRDADALVEAVRAVRYRGASSHAGLAADRTPARHCLMFANGAPAIDRESRFAPACRLDVVASGAAPDRAYLRGLAAASGGGLIEAGDAAAAVARLGALEFELLGDDDTRLPTLRLDTGAGRYALIARLPDRGGVRLVLGPLESRLTLPEAVAFDGEGALLAADRLAMLGAGDRRADFVALSRRYGVASESLSYLVLETPADYLQADIAPPASYPAALADAYRRLVKATGDDEARARVNRLVEVVGMWAEQVRWWERRFPTLTEVRSTRVERGETSVDAITAEEDSDIVLTGSPAPSPPAPPPVSTAPPPPPPPPALYSPSDGAEIVVSGARAGEPASSTNDPARTVIAIDAWQPDRPYIRALEAAPDAFDRVFAEQEALHGTIPAFYLDVAAWLRARGSTAAAIEMALGALDLPTANEVTLGMVADRMEQYGAHDRAVELRERHLRLDPDRPQTKRLLALALGRRAAFQSATARADLERAIALLGEVALEPIDDRWNGIELIALGEANAMIPRLERLGGRATLDPRLVKLLDVDVRVVIDWTTDATDLDLWVDEPSGERAIFSNPRTAIGGRLSNDMTAGYGPEEYLLHRAPAGDYPVQVNGYAGDRIDPNGPSLMTARLIRDFGRATEREERVDVELTRDKTGARAIGRIVVPAGGGSR